MSTSQRHGTHFEHCLHPAFPGAAQACADHTAVFDIEAAHDPEGLPTSIKTTCNRTVGLADARRTFNQATPFRLLVGTYVQKGGAKEVQAIHEFKITEPEWAALQGQLPVAAVAAFHEGLLAFPVGEHAQARRWARDHKAQLKAAHPDARIQLNPKVDSQAQRRLQASVHLNDLIAQVADHTEHRTDYRGVPLPLVLDGGPRERKVKAIAVAVLPEIPPAASLNEANASATSVGKDPLEQAPFAGDALAGDQDLGA